MDRKQKIQELQRKNRLKQLSEEMRMKFGNLSDTAFLSADETTKIQKNVIAMMDDLDAQSKSNRLPNGYNYEKWIKDGLEKFKQNLNAELVVYLAWKQETFAVTLGVEELICNIDWVISMTSIANNGCSFIITNEKVDVGLCLWRTEYEIRGYQW